MAEPPRPTRLGEPMWLDPYPDAVLEGLADSAPGPEASYESGDIGGVFTLVWQKFPDGWKIIHDHTSAVGAKQ